MERQLFLSLAYKLQDGAQAWKIDDHPMPPPAVSREVQDILDYIGADDGVELDDDADSDTDPSLVSRRTQVDKPTPEPPPPPKPQPKPTRFDISTKPKPKRGDTSPVKSGGLAGANRLPALPPPEEPPSRGLAAECNCPPVNDQRPQRDAKCWVCGSPRFWRSAVSGPGDVWRCKKCHPPGNVNFIECNTHADRTIR